VTSSGIQASIPFHLFCHPSPPCSFIFYHCHYYNDDGDDDDDDDDDDDVNPW